MVFSGNKRGGEHMERLNPLHNFDLPYLKWGNQKLLRCMNVDSTGESPLSDLFPSPESYSAKRFRSTPSEKVPARIRVTGESSGEIAATREKLMSDFQKQVGEMKVAIQKRLVYPPAPETLTVFESPAERPWNLRTRRAACKVTTAVNSPLNCNDDVLKPNCSPVRNECGEAKLRRKFSVCLLRREVEEDFMAMAGRRPPRKPKKRPRVVQKQLDTLFPGLWLSEITADLYKVPDEAETGKR